MLINRNDMLELTRRMTPQRNCFLRMAGCYLDEDGYSEGGFNINFQKLSTKDKTYNLNLAKTIPFAKTNAELKAYPFPGKAAHSKQMAQFLYGMLDCELKNDELMELFYELMADKLSLKGQYSINVFQGNYDVPVKASDKTRLDESEEVYSFLICTISRWSGDYEVDLPEYGFLYPAFTDRSSDPSHICIYGKSENHIYDMLVHDFLGIGDH